MSNNKSSITKLIESADTPEKQAEIRQKVAELFRASKSLEDFAKTLGLEVGIIKKGRHEVKQLLVDESLKARMPDVIERRWKEMKEREAEEEVSKALPEGIEFKKLDQTFLPPDDQEIATEGVEEEMKEPRLFPRTRLAIEAIKGIGIDLNKCKFLEGVNDSNMVRNLSYRAIVVPELDRIILICDEERNRTFIIYQSEHCEFFYKLRKSQLKAMGGLVSSLRWSDADDWKLKLIELLNKRPNVKKKTKKPKSKNSNEINKTPEGWLTGSQLANKLSISYSFLKKTSEKFRLLYPRYFSKYKDKIGHTRDHYSPLLYRIFKDEIESERAPKNWRKLSEICDELGVDSSKIANLFKQRKIKWFRNFRSPGGKMTKYLSPEICEEIRKEINKYKKAPEGWMTNRAFSSQENINQYTLDKITEELESLMPDEFEKYRHITGHDLKFFSPKIVQLIKQKLSEKKRAPEMWVNAFQLTIKLNEQYSQVSTIAKKIGKARPEWIKDYVSETGVTCPHFSPELAQAIKEKIMQHQAVPENWKTPAKLATDLNAHHHRIKRIAKLFSKTNPDWVKKFSKIPSGKKQPHYSPELCEKIAQEIKIDKKRPEGWMTIGGLAKKRGISEGTIKKLAMPYHETNPEWFREYEYQKGKTSEHYAPELCEKIAEEYFAVDNTPPSWMTNKGLSKEIKVDQGTTKKRAEIHRETNPEWFEEYRDKTGQPREHYSPKLCELIRQELKK